jgi:hypothetical protein
LSNTGHGAWLRGEKNWPLLDKRAAEFRKVAVGAITISVECSQSKLATTFLLFVSSFLHLSFP